MNSGLFADIATDDKNLIGSAVHLFAECNTRLDLFNAIQTIMVPLLQLDGVFISSFNQQSGETKIVGKADIIKILSPRVTSLINLIVCNNNPAKYATSPGIAVFDGNDCQTQQMTGNSAMEWSLLQNNFKTITGVFDTPSPTAGIWFYRKDNKANPFASREINIIKYMQPILIQAIKTISRQEDKAAFSNIAEHILSPNVPEAIINNEGSVLFSNMKFSEQISQTKNIVLPQQLYTHILKLINKQSRLPENSNLISYNAFFRHNSRHYEVHFSPVENSEAPLVKNWLLTLKRKSDTSRHLNRTLQDANITHRETEIISWLQKGLSCLDIATQLNLSYHTAKTHVKNIHKKLNISSSQELLAFVNQPGV